MPQANRTALIAGASGLVGQRLLRRLLDSPRYTKVKVLTRRPLNYEEGRLEPLLTDFEDLGALNGLLAADDVYCCLGTTLRKAGSRAAFERVDYHMVVDLARATAALGAKQFLVVSAVGASKRSPAFYSRVKARMEEAVSDAGFAAVHIVRPSLLLGHRAESRPAEDLAQRVAPLIAPLFWGPFLKYRPVNVDEVAEAMEKLAAGGKSGAHVHHLPLKV